MTDSWPWLALALLGAYHGINPAMGWLFAVALGLQERRRRAVLLALFPIALGHALSIGLTLVLLGVARLAVPAHWLAVICAIALFSFGLYKLIRSSHPRWVGMRVGFRDLTAWSFLMATAHGAGLMLAPVLLSAGIEGRTDFSADSHAHSTALASSAAMARTDLLAVTLHTAAMFVVMGLVAIAVYDLVGLKILRQAWFNLERLWALALMAAGVLTLLLHI